MARSSKKNVHIGGQQLPLITPDSTWVPPSELPDLRGCSEVVVDIENRDDGLSAGRGSSWPYKGGHICGVAVAWDGGSFYAPVAHPDTDCLPVENVRRWVEDHFRSGVRVVFHHGSHDMGWLRAEWGIDPPAVIGDTEAMAMIVDENRLSYRLDDLCRWRGVVGKDEGDLRAAAIAYNFTGNMKGNIYRFPARFVGPYAEADARATLGLACSLLPVIQAEGTWDAYQLEMDIMPMVLEMRRRGVRVNVEGATAAKVQLLTARDDVLAKLSERLGQRVGIDECRSPRVMEQWFTSEKIAFLRTEKTHQGSFQASWMRKHPHWLPRLVARAEQLTEAADKFIQNYILDYAHRGRIHASINQFRGEEGGTRSFRFSYADPPLQQAPSRDEEFKELFRGFFEPEEGEQWLAADYSQQEYRLIVHYAALLGCAQADAAAQLYRDKPDTDFHMLVVDWTGLERKPAKDTNFAKAFGAGVPKFATMIGKSEDEAREIYELYDKKLPFVKELSQRCQKAADTRGYIRLIDNCRSHFDSWEVAWREPGEKFETRSREAALAFEPWRGRRIRRALTHKAMNRLIQGSAARQTKTSGRDLWRAGICPLLQMHDEWGVSAGDAKRGQQVQEIMVNAVKLEVPVKVDLEIGPTWGDATHPPEVDSNWMVHGRRSLASVMERLRQGLSGDA